MGREERFSMNNVGLAKNAESDLLTTNKETCIDHSASESREPHCKEPIPKTVWFMGMVMFLINTSFLMIYSLSGVFLKTDIGVNTAVIGMLEGVVEAASYAFKLFSGIASDYFRRRKSIMLIGYGLMVISRPVVAVSSSFFVVLFARLMERLGNGIQATPRDALISDVAPPRRRGASFGVMRGMGTAGSTFGGIMATLLMWWTYNNFRQVFWFATLPAVIAFFILLRFIREPDQNLHPKDHQKRHPIHLADLPRLGKSYWVFMVVVAIFLSSRMSETMLVLHAHDNFQLSPTFIPLVMIVFNIAYSISSFYLGNLSDKVGRRTLLFAGVLALILADIVLGIAPNIYVMFFGVVLWGLQMGISNSVFMAYIADQAPEDLRGTAFGFYYFIAAIASLIAGFYGGQLAHLFHESVAFLAGAGIATVSLLILAFFLPKNEDKFKC